MTGMNQMFQQGSAASKWPKLTVIFIIATALVGGVMIWALISYFVQKADVDSKVANAVATATKEQADKDEANFAQREKDPNLTFVGPEDYGSLSFDYPRTWSIYVASDASNGGTYQAYLNPISVPTVSTTQQFALRITIESKDYSQVVSSYDSLVKKGDLKSSVVKSGDQNGTRLDGSFSKDIRGAAVIFKIRDKTATIRSDADTFKTDFDALVATIKFNQ